MTPLTRFNEFLQDIEPSATTKSNASSAHTNLRNHLKQDLDYKDTHIDTFLSGSYKRDTAIRPKVKDGKKDRPDVDIFVLTNHTLDDDPATVLDQLYKALKKKYPVSRVQSRSIGIETSLADMDVVPAIQSYGDGGHVYIPDRHLEQWVETNPQYHTQWTTDTNNTFKGRFKPLVKILKWWRRENKTISKQPKGYAIEVMAANNMPNYEQHYGEVFVQTLEAVVKNYKYYVDMEQVPFISDPAITSNNVLGGLSFEQFKGFYNKVELHACLGRQALDEDDQDKATVLWQKIFGLRFPSNVSNKTEALLGSAVVPGLSFPDHPIKPTGPKGFA